MENKYWCSIFLKAEYIRAQIIHLGGGKFKIVHDEGGAYTNKIIDASDVIYCDVEAPVEQNSDFEGFCKEILGLSKFIRFSSIANSIGAVITSVYREGVIPLIPKQEFSQRSVFSTIRENFESRIGMLEYVIGRYGKLVYGIVPISAKKEYYLILSFDINSDVEPIIRDRIIPLVKSKDIP